MIQKEDSPMFEMVEAVQKGIHVGFVEPKKYDSVHFSLMPLPNLPNYALGKVDEVSDDNSLNVRLGIEAVYRFASDHEIPPQNERDLYEYMGVSIYAGNILFNGLYRLFGSSSAGGKVLFNKLTSISPLSDDLTEFAFNSMGIHEPIEEQLRALEFLSEEEIATINNHRMGAGYILQIAECMRKPTFTEIFKQLKTGFGHRIASIAKSDYPIALQISGSEDQAARLLTERTIKQPGLGLLFPASKKELLQFRKDLYEAQIDNDGYASLRALLDPEEAWRETIELSEQVLFVDESEYDGKDGISISDQI